MHAHCFKGYFPGELQLVSCSLILFLYLFKREALGITGTGFYGPDALPITQPCHTTESNHFILNNEYQLSLTNPQDVLHHGKCAANKGECSVC